jgi:hypothetical protein
VLYPNKKVFRPFFFCIHPVTCIVYLDLLEAFLMSILEEEGPSDMLLTTRWSACTFPQERNWFLKSKVSREMDGQEWA